MPYSRRAFLAHSAVVPALALARPGTQQLPPLGLGPDDGEPLLVGPTHDPVRIKISPPDGGRFAMITQDMATGSRVPVHLHEREDEIIFIQRGEGTATIGNQRVTLTAGSTLYVPQGTWHGGENTGRERMLWVAIYSPSGFEGYFREIAIQPDTGAPPSLTMDERIALDRRYGIRYPG